MGRPRRVLVAFAVAIAALGIFASANASAASLPHCQHVRGYYNVRVSGVSCKRATRILWNARQGKLHQTTGWNCRTTGHGPGGGFPAETVCRKQRAMASGWVIDGPA